ncbi:hypothetical protein CspHIS471_0311860 [Cutaneotrichosporon sp. HIS471]|nr:hypothetical protein CspHIS471_0311860 [Cutaneotrichosporon sp. HIS471]
MLTNLFSYKFKETTYADIALVAAPLGAMSTLIYVAVSSLNAYLPNLLAVACAVLVFTFCAHICWVAWEGFTSERDEQDEV